MKLIKRNGTEAEFDKNKIISAIKKANCEVHEEAKISQSLILTIANDVTDDCEKMPQSPTVEDVQDLVQYYLMKYGAYFVVTKYINYRHDRELVRESKKYLIDAVAEKLSASNVENQNANLDEKSFSGRIGEASRIVMKDYALNNCMSQMSKENHLNNEIYIHDLDSYAVGMSNCLTIPYSKILANGFNTRQTDVRPANSINTALQLVAVIAQLQSQQQFGGVSAGSLDWTLVPYVRKSFRKHYIVSYIKNKKKFLDLDLENMLFDSYTDEVGIIRNKLDDWIDEQKESFYKELGLAEDDFRFDNKENLDPVLYQSALYDTIIETKQAVEGMYHNLNTLQSRSGGQLPFSSINYGTCTLPEGRLLTKCFLDVSIIGLGSLHRTSIFPCGIFQLMRGVNRAPGDPNYDLYKLAIKSTSKRLYPNYANVDWSGNEGYDRNDPRTYFSTMGK